MEKGSIVLKLWRVEVDRKAYHVAEHLDINLMKLTSLKHFAKTRILEDPRVMGGARPLGTYIQNDVPVVTGHLCKNDLIPTLVSSSLALHHEF